MGAGQSEDRGCACGKGGKGWAERAGGGEAEFGKIRRHVERLAAEAEGHRGAGPWAPRWSCGHWGR